MMHSNFVFSNTATRARFCVLVVSTLILVVACGSSTTTTTAPSTTAPSSTATSSGGRYGYGGGNTTPTSSTSGSSNLIKMATATVSGKSVPILTNAQGMTLYSRTRDMPPTTVCSGGCASAWPPLLVSGSSTPTSTTSLSGKLSVQADANGNQVEYNGHPLYTYSGDTAPGQTTGEGVGGVWHVCTPSLT